jgi:hypothetical protein
MNTLPPSNPTQDMLDAEERELAKIVRALPGGEPPVALDALILKAASDAVSSQSSTTKSRFAKGLLSSSVMWLGTAAASILTVGVGWQVYQSLRAPINEIGIYEPGNVAMEKSSNNSANSMVIEMQAPREPAPTSPPPPETAMNAEMEAKKDLSRARAPAANGSAIAQGALADSVSKDKAAMPADDWVAPAPQSVAADAAAESAMPAVASARAPAAPVVAARQAAKKETVNANNAFNEVAVTGSRIKQAETETASPVAKQRREQLEKTGAEANSDALEPVKPIGTRIKRDNPDLDHVLIIPPEQIERDMANEVAEDAKLAPREWFASIRGRRDIGDLKTAKQSLKKFHETYPQLRIPNDLKPLLR